jgi:hypothetical protein
VNFRHKMGIMKTLKLGCHRNDEQRRLTRSKKETNSINDMCDIFF